jgi:hypothetical protein
VIKRTQKKAIKRRTQILAEICQNRIADKGRIFKGFSIAQIKKCSTNESLDITWDICKRNHRSKYIQRIYTNFYGAAPKTVSGQQHPQIFTSLKLEASLGTTMK